MDGTNYTGNTRTIPLINSNNMVEVTDPAKLSISGFDSNTYNAQIVQDQTDGRDWVALEITRE